MSRANKRAGFGALRGATNARRTISEIAPNNPSNFDEWLKKSTNQVFYWDKELDDWVEISGSIANILTYNNISSKAVTTNTEIASISVEISSATNILCVGCFVGQASESTLLTYILKKNGNTINTFKKQITGAFYDTLAFDVPSLGTAVGNQTFSVDLSASAGTFTLDANEQSFYIYGVGFAGIGAAPPNISVNQNVSGASVSNNITIDSDASLLTDISVTGSDTNISANVSGGISNDTATVTLA